MSNDDIDITQDDTLQNEQTGDDSFDTGNIDEAEIAYPDGIGLSIDELRAVLAEKHETIVPKDDPILLVVTILNAFLGENQKLQEKYQEALKTIYSEQVKDFLKEVQKNTGDITSSLQSLSLDGLHKVHNEQVKELSRFSTHLLYATGIVALSALINVAVFIWS